MVDGRVGQNLFDLVVENQILSVPSDGQNSMRRIDILILDDYDAHGLRSEAQGF